MIDKKKALMTIVYFALAIPMFYFVESSISIGGIGFMYMYLFGIAIIVFAAILFLVFPDLKRLILSFRYGMVIAAPYLWTVLYSLFFWVITMAGFTVMRKGVFYVVYQFIAIAVAAATVYMFGSNGMYYQFFAVAVANVIIMIQTIMEYGFGEFITEYFSVVTSFSIETGSGMKIFEALGFSFGIAFFLIYFMLDFKKNKRRIPWFIVGVLLFFMGLKRIVLAAIVITVLVGLLLFRFARKHAKGVVYFIASAALVLAFVYIVAVRLGLYTWLESIGVDSMGRDVIYERIYDIYELGIGYLGRGAGFITEAALSGSLDLALSDGYSVAAIHNDLLRQYIELGFVGNIIWIVLFLHFRIRYFFHKSENDMDRRHGILAAAVFFALFITFTTDNTNYYYYTTLFSSMAVMCFRYDEYAEKIRLPGDEMM